MSNLWFDYYLIRFGILALILVCSAVAVIFFTVRKRWQRRQEALELELADCQAAHFQKLYSDFQRIVAHEYGKGLNYILNKSSETLEGLGKEQTALRDKQDGIIAKSNELQQHSMNIPYVFAFEPHKLKKELLNIRQLIESVLLELFPYAESQGVTLRPNLADIEPIFLDRDLTKLAIRNLVHNAIKYSERGRVVEIILTVEEGGASQEKEAVITIKDSGRGIKDDDKDSLFELNMRGDGLIETGSGLGLYCTRRAARLQGGDVILESSSPNQGSVFTVRFPYETPGEAVQSTEAEPPRRDQSVLRWGFAVLGVVATAVLLFVLFKPPPIVALVTYHDNYGYRYVSAQGLDNGWALTQKEALDDCGKFALIRRGDKVAFLTCHDRYITAPWKPNPDPVTNQHDRQWLLGQDPGFGDCELFGMEDRPNDPERLSDKISLWTCAGMVVTAADGGWPGEMAWSVVAERDEVQGWEEFILEPQR